MCFVSSIRNLLAAVSMLSSLHSIVGVGGSSLRGGGGDSGRILNPDPDVNVYTSSFYGAFETSNAIGINHSERTGLRRRLKFISESGNSGTYSDKYVKYDETLTEFIFRGWSDSNHKRIVLSEIKPDSYTHRTIPGTTGEIATIGLFPNNRVWSSQYFRQLTTYNEYDDFKLKLEIDANNSTNNVVKLYKDVDDHFEDTGYSFPASDITGFYASIWFYEVGGQVETIPTN